MMRSPGSETQQNILLAAVPNSFLGDELRGHYLLFQHCRYKNIANVLVRINQTS
jgi:hypothetical protein